MVIDGGEGVDSNGILQAGSGLDMVVWKLETEAKRNPDIRIAGVL